MPASHTEPSASCNPGTQTFEDANVAVASPEDIYLELPKGAIGTSLPGTDVGSPEGAAVRPCLHESALGCVVRQLIRHS